MSLIQPTDFNDIEILIPNTHETVTKNNVQMFINKYEPKFLNELFGEKMGTEMYNALAVFEDVISFTGVSQAIISNYESKYYADLGNNPRILINQVLDSGTRNRRNDVFPNKQILNGIVQSISFDFGVVGNYEVILSKQLSDEDVINIPAGTSPIVLSDWQDTYDELFGNNPRIDVYEVNGNSRLLRNDAGVTLLGQPLDSVEIYLGNAPQVSAVLYGNSPFIDNKWLQLGQNADLKQALRCYVYCKWKKDNVTFTTSMGDKKGQTQNSIDASSTYKKVRAWNEMVSLNWKLNNTLDREIYPDYQRLSYYGGSLYGNYGYGCWLSEVYKPENTLGL